ncbi:MAG: CPBP family intramembrane metalloprotease [Porphyromonadaceae bacterium]|nr:CPBP family intramembrane metalloprotease [Porphyromonadaceae bacterium]
MILLSLKKSLKVLILEVIEFAKEDFHKKSYFFVALLLSTLLIANYKFGLYPNWIRSSYYTGASWWVMPLFYLTIYFIAAVPTLLFRKEFSTLKNPNFYLKSGFFVALYGIAVGFFKYSDFSFANLTIQEAYFVKQVISQLKCSVFFLLPLFLMKLTIDKQVNGFYGIARNPKHLNAYFTLFLVMIPFLVLTSFTKDFLSAYPQFRPWYFDKIFGMKTWEYTLIYEISYAIDFIMTELIFRGTLVVGVMLLMGRSAILPMVVFYCSIHFGKPVLEAVSSIFGGYILGALAYQTRHIWGGIMVHICVALTMEVMGFWHYYFKNP